MRANTIYAPFGSERDRIQVTDAQNEALHYVLEAARRDYADPWGLRTTATGGISRSWVMILEQIGRHLPDPSFRGSFATHLDLIEHLRTRSDYDPSGSMSAVFRWINDLLLFGHFRACDQLLRSVPVYELAYPVVLSFLTFTFAAREHLEERPQLYDRIWERIAKSKGNDVADELLKTLK